MERRICDKINPGAAGKQVIQPPEQIPACDTDVLNSSLVCLIKDIAEPAHGGTAYFFNGMGTRHSCSTSS